MTELVDRVVADFLRERKFKSLNKTQEAALRAGIYDSEPNALVIAPTGAGKTGVADIVIRTSLAAEPKKRAIYVAPLASLVWAKYKELKKYLPSAEVMRFSEPGWQDEADVLVGTNEQVYTQFLMAPDTLTNFSVLILDELHIMYQRNRGDTVEKILTLAKIHELRIVALSATVEDRKRLAEWLEAIPVVVPEEDRPIKLVDHDLDEHSFNADLVKFDKPPVLIFCATKPWTESRAIDLAIYLDSLKRKKDPKAEEAAKRIEDALDVEITERLEALLLCIKEGVAWYHADIPGTLKGMILDAYENGAIRYLFTTTALAFGFDSPTRTVVVYDLKRWDPESRGQKSIGVHEFRQMAGRAGRPSKAEFNDGYLCGVIKDASTPPELQRYRTAPLEAVDSFIGTVDDNFRKTILELILSGKTHADELLGFFKATFYGFGAEDSTSLGIFYSLENDVQGRLKTLVDDDFVLPRPRGQFSLTDFGRFVAEFELDPSRSNELKVYSELRRYLAASFDRGDELPFTAEVLFKLCRTLGYSLSKTRGATLDDDVGRLYTSRGWNVNDGAARAALAVLFGWLEGVSAPTIEKRFGVYIDAVQSAAEGLANEAIPLIVGLANLQGIIPSSLYEDLPDRLKYGVTEGMLNLVRIDGIARKRALAILSACDALIVTTAASIAYQDRPDKSEMKYRGKPLGKKGDRITPENVWDFLCRFHKAHGDAGLKELVKDAGGIGDVLSARVLQAIKPGKA